ncbi:MAG: TRAP transporter substrate-binding protein [Alphaproteobacteria bacterium]
MTTTAKLRLTGMAVAALAVGVFVGGVPGEGSIAEAKELKLAHFVSPKHPMHRFVMAPMAKDLAAATNGKLTIRIYPAGALGKGPKAQFKRAATGVADITFGLHGYTSNQFPRTLMVELPGLSSGPVQATRMLWAVYNSHLRAEYTKVVALALWANDSAVLITRDKPVRNLADIKGMKIRVPSKLAANLVKAWGGTPVPMPVPKVYNALKTGIVDGVFIGASGIRSFKLNEAGNYVTTGLPVTVAGFYLVMNRKAYNALSAAEKSALAKVSGRARSLKAASIYARAGTGGLKLFAKTKKVIALSPAEAAKFRAVANKVVTGTVSGLEKRGIAGRDIYKAMRATK